MRGCPVCSSDFCFKLPLFFLSLLPRDFYLKTHNMPRGTAAYLKHSQASLIRPVIGVYAEENVPRHGGGGGLNKHSRPVYASYAAQEEIVLHCPSACACICVSGKGAVCKGNSNCRCQGSCPSPKPTVLHCPSACPCICVSGKGAVCKGNSNCKCQGSCPSSSAGTHAMPSCHGIPCGPGTGATCGGLGCPGLDPPSPRQPAKLTGSLKGPSGFFGPGGEIIATPEYADAYRKQYHMPYSGTVGFRDKTGKLILGMTNPDGSFTQTGYYDTGGRFHSTVGMMGQQYAQRQQGGPGTGLVSGLPVAGAIRDYLGSRGADTPSSFLVNKGVNYGTVNYAQGIIQKVQQGQVKITDVPQIIKQGLCTIGVPLCAQPSFNPRPLAEGIGAAGGVAGRVGGIFEGLGPDIMWQIEKPLVLQATTTVG